MGTWRDRLVWANENKKASFRGADFFIKDSDYIVGRRNVVHQYPFKDIPYIEDLGQDTDEFTINGYVIQNDDNDQDYITERDDLISALRTYGPGTLIHPYYGELFVNLIGKARIEESFIQGGIARFTMVFILAGVGAVVAPYPKTTSDFVETTDAMAEKSLGMATDDFSDGFDPEEISSHMQNSIMNAIGSLNKMLRSVSMSVQAAFPSQVSRALKYLANDYALIDINAISNACSLASGITGMFNGLKSIAGMYGELLSDQLFGACSNIVYGQYSGPMSSVMILSSKTDEGKITGFEASTMESLAKINENLGKTTVRAMLAINQFGEASVYGGIVEAVPILTCKDARNSANLLSLVNFIRINAIIFAIQVAVRIDYTSYNSAIEMMKEVIEELDALTLKIGNDAADTDYDDYNITVASPRSYQAIDSLRPVFVESMIGIGGALSKVIDYEVPPVTISTLALAYERYYDLDRESEIIKRNINIKHPGFLPEGKMIEMLNE